MKKLLGILVLGLLFCNVAIAKLNHKDGEDNTMYNFMVDHYNKYLEEQSDAADFCAGVVPMGLDYLTKKMEINIFILYLAHTVLRLLF